LHEATSKRLAMRRVASLEAAIDAVAEANGMAIDENHWRRSRITTEPYKGGVLPMDLVPLHKLLNEERKAVFYDGADPDLGDISIAEVLGDVATVVEIAEAEPR
jgi:hypothetical protein